MNLITANVLRHLGAQVLAAAILGALGALKGVDWSALGAYAPLVAMTLSTVTGVVTSMVNEWLGTAPAK